MKNNLILAGVVIAAHGIRGNVIVKSFTDPVNNICNLPLSDETGNVMQLKLISINSKKDLICSLNNIHDRTTAEKLIKTKIFCYNYQLPEIKDKDEFYVESLKHLGVVDKNMVSIGKITNCFNFGAGDIIEIFFDDGTVQLFPFTKEIFPEITESYILMIQPSYS